MRAWIFAVSMISISTSLYSGCPDSEDDDTETPESPTPEDMTAGSMTVQVESSVASDVGIATRIFYPSTSNARYLEGAPIALVVPGGWGGGSLSPEGVNSFADTYGYIIVEFLMPGVSSDGVESGGTFDYRGSDSMVAIRDVLNYLAGLNEDTNNNTILDNIPFAYVDNIGILGKSNGGNLSLITLAEEKDSLPDISWFVAWESPIGDQYAAVELNNNPYYTPGTCNVVTCPLTGMEETFRFDPNAKTLAQDSHQETILLPGVFYLDTDGSESFTYDPAEFMFKPINGKGSDVEPPKWFQSREFMKTLQKNLATVMNGEPIPDWLSTESESIDFWVLHDSAPRISEVSTAFPNILTMHLGSVNDHVQDVVDYPHAYSHIKGWLDSGHVFTRLNPDASYMSAVSGFASSYFPDNNANTSVPRTSVSNYMVVDKISGVAIDPYLEIAGMLELMDRTYTSDLSENLDDVIY